MPATTASDSHRAAVSEFESLRLASGATAANPSPAVSGRVDSLGEERPGTPGTGGVTPGQRASAERLIGYIGSEFNLLRKKGRSAAWASLEEKVAEGGSLLIATGMITMKDWTGMLIDIEQFRKAEGGSEELPGDALAKWLSEPTTKPKTAKPVPLPSVSVEEDE